MVSDEERRAALAMELASDIDEVEEVDYAPGRDNVFRVGDAEYRVLTDGEADEAWDQELEWFMDEFLLQGVHERVHCYFDRDRCKDDLRIDGRGHCLSRYDGCEIDLPNMVEVLSGPPDEYEPSGETLYAYRVN